MKKLLAILLAFILTFSCVSLLSTGVALAETQEMGVNLIESDFHKSLTDANNKSMWQGTNGAVTYLDDDNDSTTDFARITAVSGAIGAFYSSTAIVYPGNTYEFSYYVRVPGDVVTQDFSAYPLNDNTYRFSPKFAIYQPTNTNAGERVKSTYGEGKNEYAYSYVSDQTTTRRTDFSSTWEIGNYAPYVKKGDSVFGIQHYDACKDENGNSVSPNAVYENWTKVTMTFTAIEDAENQGPQVIAFVARIDKDVVGLCYDIKDFSLVCTDNGTATKTILESDFEEDVASSKWSTVGDVQSMTEDAGKFARLNTGVNGTTASVRSRTIKLIPGNKYTLTYSVRIPTGSADYATVLADKGFYLSPECAIHIPKNVTSEDVQYTGNLTDTRLYATANADRRKNMNFVWNVEGYEPKTRIGYSDTGYAKKTDVFYTLISTEDGTTPSSPNDVFSDWKKVTLEFTAEAETEGSTDPTFVVLQFRAMGSGLAANVIYDIKDVTLTEAASKIKPEPDHDDAIFYQGFESSPNPTDVVTVYTGASQNVTWVNPTITSSDAATGSKAYSVFAMYQDIFIPFDKSKLQADTVYSFSMDWMLNEYTSTKQRRINNVYAVGYTPTEGVTLKNGYEAFGGKGEARGTGNWEALNFNFKISEAKFNKYEQIGIYISYKTSGTNTDPDDRLYLDTLMLKVSENQDVVNKLELNESERTENTVKVLAFGNSFSNDGTSFIPQIAYADGVDLRVADCSIGGCSLAKHYENSVTNASAYSFAFRTPLSQGTSSKSFTQVTVEQALTASDWDYITIQQVSTLSGDSTSFEPYLGKLIEKFKEYCPNAKIVFQMTWAYRDGIVKDGYEKYGNDQETMYNAIVNTYLQYAEKYDVEFIIPSGETIQSLRALISDGTGSETDTNMFSSEIASTTSDAGDFTRDGYHLSQKGRVAAAFTWYEIFTGISALDTKIDLTTSAYGTLSNTTDTLIGITAEEALAIKTAAHNAASLYKKAVETTKAIKAIGEVTADSGEAIENAKALREDLNNDKLIINLQALLAAIETFENLGSSDEVLGDFDGTGEVDIEDIAQLARHFAGWKDFELADANLDISGDGLVNLYDLVKLAQIVANWPN